MHVPLVSEYAYAGYLCGYNNPEYLSQLPTEPFVVDKEGKGNYLTFQVRGHSMNDGTPSAYLPGDKLLCRELPKHHWTNKLHIHKWDWIIVHETDGILFKRITQHNLTTGDITVHSTNTFYDDIELNLKHVKQLFNVVFFKHDICK